MSLAPRRLIDRAASAFAVFVLLAAVTWLLISGFAKLADISVFADAISRQGLLPHSIMPFATWAVPLAEVTVGIAALRWLLADSSSRAAWWLCSAAFACLGTYAGFLWLNPPAVPAPCGCAGSSTPVADWGDLAIRNVGVSLVLMGAPVFRRVPRPSSDARCTLARESVQAT